MCQKNDSIKQKIFDFAFLEALDDATRRVYTGKENIENNSCARKLIKEYIDSILSGNPSDFYVVEQEVKKAINKAIDCKKGDNGYFNFGKTQKLINMTVKYMYSMCYADESLRENFKNCHCPMDSRVVAKLFEMELVKKGSALKRGTAWSKLMSKDGEYEAFQGIVSQYCKENGCNPIEADYFLWQK